MNEDNIGSRWVYKLKADGTNEGEFVALGWNQVSGVDYDGIFASACKLQSIRIAVAVTAELDWEAYQMGMKGGKFLNADIEEVHVKVVPGYETKEIESSTVVMLNQPWASS